MSISVVIIAIWMLFVGAVWDTWITINQHDFGVLTVIIGIVVLVIEIFTHHGPWKRLS